MPIKIKENVYSSYEIGMYNYNDVKYNFFGVHIRPHEALLNQRVHINLQKLSLLELWLFLQPRASRDYANQSS